MPGHPAIPARAREVANMVGLAMLIMLMVLAFTTVSAVLGQSTLRGMTSLFLGLALGLVGIRNPLREVPCESCPGGAITGAPAAVGSAA